MYGAWGCRSERGSLEFARPVQATRTLPMHKPLGLGLAASLASPCADSLFESDLLADVKLNFAHYPDRGRPDVTFSRASASRRAVRSRTNPRAVSHQSSTYDCYGCQLHSYCIWLCGDMCSSGKVARRRTVQKPTSQWSPNSVISGYPIWCETPRCRSAMCG